eukprot:RCo055603
MSVLLQGRARGMQCGSFELGAGFQRVPRRAHRYDELEGKTHYKNYDTHYVPVVPIDPDDHDSNVYVPAAEGQAPIYDELVVFNCHQAFARYVIHFMPNSSR